MQIKKEQAPVELTVNGKAEAYQRLLDIAARAEVEEGIRQGLQDARKGRTRPAREFFDEFETAHR